MMRGARLALAVSVGLLTAACSHQSTATPQTGTLNVHVSASGTSVDTTFSVTVDGNYTYTVTTGQDASFQVDEYSHTITLGDVASNCKVESTNPQIVQVAIGSEGTVDFTVSCSTNGQAAVTIATTGTNQDDQYTLSFNNDFYQVPVGPRQTVMASLPVGTYSVELSGVASNCQVQSANPQSMELVQDSTTAITFPVVCQ